MGKEDIGKSVIELGKAFENLDNIKKEINDLKQQKGQLENNIIILKRSNKEEQDKFNKIKSENDKILLELNNELSKLQENRNKLANSVIPELQKLENLKNSNISLKSELDKISQNIYLREKSLLDGQDKLNKKIFIVNQIIEISKKL